MPPEVPTPFWVYVNSRVAGNFTREPQATALAKKKVNKSNEVVVIQVKAFGHETRLHVWVNGVQTVRNGKNTGK